MKKEPICLLPINQQFAVIFMQIVLNSIVSNYEEQFGTSALVFDGGAPDYLLSQENYDL